jgi:hypothetical protein
VKHVEIGEGGQALLYGHGRYRAPSTSLECKAAQALSEPTP